MMSYYDINGHIDLKRLWNLINWDKQGRIVSCIQTRIVKAVKVGLKEKVRSLQRLLSNSLAAKLLAIKRVISNRGKRTPGVDNYLIDTPEKRWETLQKSNLPGYKAAPLKRLYIPKKNGKKRPLGIPVMHDRVEQALDLLGLDPVSETLADIHSYGFRKFRSTWDTMGVEDRPKSFTIGKTVERGNLVSPSGIFRQMLPIKRRIVGGVGVRCRKITEFINNIKSH